GLRISGADTRARVGTIVVISVVGTAALSGPTRDAGRSGGTTVMPPSATVVCTGGVLLEHPPETATQTREQTAEVTARPVRRTQGFCTFCTFRLSISRMPQAPPDARSWSW